MKKVLIVIVCIILSNCECKTRSAMADDRFYYNYKEEVVHGMTYGIWVNTGYSSVTVVNLTKDKLEVELLQRQLKVVN